MTAKKIFNCDNCSVGDSRGNCCKKKSCIPYIKKWLESQAKDSQPEEEAEDNFMDALNGTAAEVWEESEVEEDDRE